MAQGRSSDPNPELDRESAERALLGLPEIELLGVLRDSSNYTFLARLSGPGDGGLPRELMAVYKPAEGETPLWDFEAGTLYRREVAAYVLAKALGWPRIPPTVVRREAPYGVGALQLFVDADRELHYFRNGGHAEEGWLEVAAFDLVANNADRKSGHCLIDHARRLWLIDHGLTFHTQPKLRTVIWEFAGRRLPESMAGDLARAAAELDGGALGGQLRDLLSRAELSLLKRRLRTASKPGFELPEASSAWSIPWPPI